MRILLHPEIEEYLSSFWHDTKHVMFYHLISFALLSI